MTLKGQISDIYKDIETIKSLFNDLDNDLDDDLDLDEDMWLLSLDGNIS